MGKTCSGVMAGKVDAVAMCDGATSIGRDIGLTPPAETIDGLQREFAEPYAKRAGLLPRKYIKVHRILTRTPTARGRSGWVAALCAISRTSPCSSGGLQRYVLAAVRAARISGSA